MNIEVLAADVVDQIAAGEVLERPSHLIKELIENSLDAGASEIEVEFAQGGRQVMVKDNGHGIASKDLAKAFLRHATSKIRRSDDLFRLTSFGFRGEALASVAAVSSLQIQSKAKGESESYRLQGEYGVFSDPQPSEGEPGTTLWIHNLFENVPARLKFLKSEAAEHGQIKQILKALALSNPDVQFRVRLKGELLYFWPKASFAERAQDILGVTLYEGQNEENGLHVRSLLAAPHDVLHQNRGLWLFVQGRYVQDRALAAAVAEGYRNLLMHGEYPIAVIDIQTPKDFVDVNVHPTKSQVKFENASTVFRAVVHAVRSVLEKAPWLGENERAVATATRPQPVESVAPTIAPPVTTERFQDESFGRIQYSQKSFPLTQVRDSLNRIEMDSELTRPFLTPDPTTTEPSTVSAGSTDFRWVNLQILGQADQTYIVAQSDRGLYLIDQHASHERVMFEKLMQQFKGGRFDIQNYLIPLVVELTPEEADACKDSLGELEKMGLSIEQIGPEQLAVSAAPTFVKESAVDRVVRSMAREMLSQGGSFAVEKKIGDYLATMACHSVVRAGQALSVEQMRELLAEMDRFPLSSFCPHGRPVSVFYGFGDIERQFGRIV